MKQTPTRASSCGRRAHVVRRCGRVRVRVTECMTDYQNKGFEEDYTDSTGPHHSPPRATKSGGRCPHDSGERRPVQDEDIPAFGPRWKTQARFTYSKLNLIEIIPQIFFFCSFWFWTTVFNWDSQSTGRLRTKQKTNSISKSIQINTGKTGARAGTTGPKTHVIKCGTRTRNQEYMEKLINTSVFLSSVVLARTLTDKFIRYVNTNI